MFSARTAVTVTFVLNGALYASWASRVPALAEQVGTGPGGLGLALLGTAVGMAFGANAAGRATARFGVRKTVLGSATLSAFAVPLVGLATSVPMLAVMLVLLGLLIAGMDVGMNVGGMQVVHSLGRPLMPIFHAFFSVGGLLGALGAGGAVALGMSVLTHLLIVSGVALVLVWTVCRGVPEVAEAQRDEQRQDGAVKPSRRGLLWVLGVVTLCSGLAEGASTDWSALFMVQSRAVSEAGATIAFAVFSIAMAITRLAGERLQVRFGPYRLLAGASAIAAVGMAGAVLIPLPLAGFLGFGLVGAGLAFSFPVALSLAGHAGVNGGEREIGFVSGIAYTGFVGGPPLIGGIASVSSLTVSFGVIAGVIAVIPFAAKAASILRSRERRSVMMR